ncbi:MAG: tetratricopeptide repeat protein [Chryseolinea sp.]
MRKTSYYHIVFLLLSALTALSQDKDNAELKKMYDEDQSSRMANTIDWTVLSKQDVLRQARVYELIQEGKIITGNDYYHSAMMFQHGSDSIASSMAIKHMRKAIELDTSINKWLLAAAIDRDLMRRNKPQIYGTQYVKTSVQDAKWERYKMDSTLVTDQARKDYGVETLAEQRVKEREMNLASISTYSSTSIDETINFIKSEKNKGRKSKYNVSEYEINRFGYELVNLKKVDDALKVFKLNTELYPSGFNTFDSYGECLMKLNRREEALKAYKTSLDLNPKNKNARTVLDENN